MKKLMKGNDAICIGDFKGPDIEDGTFHEGESPDSASHKSKTVDRCPCPPVSLHGAPVPDDSKEDGKKDSSNNA